MPSHPFLFSSWQRLPSTVVALITPPPIWEERLERSNIGKGKRIALDRTNERTKKYASACISVGKQFDVPVLDAWTGLEGQSNNREQYLSDGIHLNAKGNHQLFELFKNMLLERLPNWLPDKLVLDKAPWSALAPKDKL